MKRVITCTLLITMVACLIGGCGNEKVGKAAISATDKIVVEQPVVDISEETTDYEVAEPYVDEDSDEIKEDITEVEEVEAVDEFPAVNDEVLELDKSDEYGVNSISCFDLDEYLDEDGVLPGSNDFDNSELDVYTGRWAYPKFTPCKYFEDLRIVYRTDRSEELTSVDSDTGDNYIFWINSGLYDWNNCNEYITDSDYDDSYGWYKHVFTADTPDGEVDVLSCFTYYMVDDIYYSYMTYTFPIGNFTVNVICESSGEDEDVIELSAEDIQTIIDNIRLTNGLER